LDTGHFHPTEDISDKISAVLPFVKGILLHISRGVRWDSDHVPILTDNIISILSEVNRSDAFSKVHLATDFFDGSINRIGAWVIGARTVMKALLISLLEPVKVLEDYEKKGELFARLGFMNDYKSFPYISAWDDYCTLKGVLKDVEWIEEVSNYEREILKERKNINN